MNCDRNGATLQVGDIVLIAGVRREIEASRPGYLLRLRGEADAFAGGDMTLVAIAGTLAAKEALEDMAADTGRRCRIVAHPVTGSPTLRR